MNELAREALRYGWSVALFCYSPGAWVCLLHHKEQDFKDQHGKGTTPEEALQQALLPVRELHAEIKAMN